MILQAISTNLIPEDISLAIPGNLGFFEFLIVFSFALHILFVNITVGSSVLAVFQEIKGMSKKNKQIDAVAQQLADHTSIMKSIAVVLGIAPLLLISVIYTQYFYSSTNLIGKAWLSLLGILIVAFLILYLYKFSWEKMQGGKKGLHVLIGAVGSIMLLFVPLIFIVNVVSMLYPEMWAGSKGFFHSLTYYPQIWQRYIHFILASFAGAGIYLYFWNRRLDRKVDNMSPDEMSSEEKKENKEIQKRAKKVGATTVMITTALQLVAGTALLMSFEKEIMMLYMGEDMLLTTLLMSSILLTLVLLFLVYRLGKTDSKGAFIGSVVVFLVILGVMGWMRHELRESYLGDYLEANPRTTEKVLPVLEEDGEVELLDEEEIDAKEDAEATEEEADADSDAAVEEDAEETTDEDADAEAEKADEDADTDEEAEETTEA